MIQLPVLGVRVTRSQLAIIFGLVLSLFMASMESTVVATAMPTIVAQLGGLSTYSWVFSAFLLTSTTTTPLYGKLSDLYGRRPVYVVAMLIFLAGSILCGRAASMTELIAFRALQGIGAGGLAPLTFIIIGDLFSFEDRARMQGVFSGVWGISSIIGPVMGGFLVDRVSWHWVFLINVVPGILALAIVWLNLRAEHAAPRAHTRATSVDWSGAVLLTASVAILLFGLFELGTPASYALLALALALIAALVWVERRAADPILPLALFRDRLFGVACAHGVLAGATLTGTASYVPLFVQAVLGASATVAGSTLSPMLLSWVGASIIGTRLLLRISYRKLAIFGMSVLTVGAFILSQLGSNANQLTLMFCLALMGAGMGLSIPVFLIAVQSAVPKTVLGAATSTIQFTRSIGGTFGVSVMGLILTLRLASDMRLAGLDPASVSVSALLDPIAAAATGSALEDTIRMILAGAIESVFIVALVTAALGLVATLFAPPGRAGAARRGPREQEQVETVSTLD